MRLRSWRVGSARAVGSTVSAARGESDSSHNSRAGHPGWLRCSSLTYSRYARSSRLAIRAPRSGTYATNHCYRTLAGVVVLCVVATGNAWGQAVTGSQLSGVVRDSSNAPIPGAEVTVTKTDTGMVRTVFTSLAG